MAVTTKTVKESTKPVDSREIAESGREAEQMSQQIQKHYGQGQQVIKSSPWQRGVAADKAKQADFQRQQQFIPKAYETTGKIEEGRTKLGDQVADFWTGYGLRADELAMKQAQQKRGQSLMDAETLARVGDELQKIEFSAFQNDAQRQDALEKAYLDGDAEIELTKAGVQGKLKIADIDRYWQMKINEIRQDLKDFEMEKDFEKEMFKQNLATDAANWGSIISGITGIAGTAAEKMDKKDWDNLGKKLGSFFGEGGTPLDKDYYPVEEDDPIYSDPSLFNE